MGKINWRNLTEGLAALSIVLSLIFVGLEVRQSSTIARTEAYQVYSISIAENAREIAHDPEFATLLVGLSTGQKTEFSITETAQLFTHFSSVLYLHHGLYQSIQEGVIPEEYLEIIRNDPEYQTPFFKGIWPRIKVYSTGSFNNFVESEVLHI